MKVLSKGLIFLFIAVLSAMPASAINGTLFSSVPPLGITFPHDTVFLQGSMGGHIWVSDHVSGFCRLDPLPGGVNAINVSTCIVGIPRKGVPGPLSPGQPALAPVNPDGTRFIYLPDDHATIQLGTNADGVWRLTFDPVKEVISSVDLLVSVGTLGTDKPVAAALDAAGNLYIGYLASTKISKVIIPPNAVLPLSGASVVPFFGTSAGIGVLAFAVANDVPPANGQGLYIAEKVVVVNGLTKISLNTGGIAKFFGTSFPLGFSPTAITPSPDGNSLLIADTPGGLIPGTASTIDSYAISTDTLTPLYTTGLLQNGKTTPFTSTSGLSIGPAGTLMIGDDPTAGFNPYTGRLWNISLTAPAGTNANQFAFMGSGGITFPIGMVWLPNATGGGHLWISDHLQGLCRLDLQPTGMYLVNATTCIVGIPKKNVAGPRSPGQVVLDPVPNADGTRFVYVPDDQATVSADATISGIWRMTFDPVTETIIFLQLLVNEITLGADKPEGAALDAAGNLYIGYIAADPITQIRNPRANLSFGQTLNFANVTARFGSAQGVGQGVMNLAVANPPPIGFTGATQALYLSLTAAGFGLKAIPLPAGGLAQNFGAQGGLGTLGRSSTGIVATPDGTTLFVADTPGGFTPGTLSTILNYTIATSSESLFSGVGVFENGTTTTPTYPMVIGLALHPLPNRLFISDDISAGLNPGQGHVWFTVPDILPPGGSGIPTTYPGLQTAAKTGDTVTLNANLFDTQPLDPLLSSRSGIKTGSANVALINSLSGTIPLIPAVLNPIGEGIYTAAVTVTNATDGRNLLNVTDVDNADTWNGSSPFSSDLLQLIVDVDNTKPVLSATAPLTLGANRSNLLSIDASDPIINGFDSGVAGVTADLTAVGGLPNNPMTLADGNATNGTWQMAITPKVTGIFALPVIATDGAGNTNTSTISVTVILPPLVTASPNQVKAGIPTNVTFNVTNNSVPVPNATVTLSGNATGTGITDSSGSTVISVNATAAGEINVTATNPAFIVPAVSSITAVLPVMKGDANGNRALDVGDVVFTLQGVAGLRQLDAAQTSAADVNGNGLMDVGDGLFIAQAVAGLRTL